MIDDDDDCYGCGISGCPNHQCKPSENGSCYEYCRSCEITLSAGALQLKADWYMSRLKAMHRLNPGLLVDLIDGVISFDDANEAAIAMQL